jgi:hypothetical protein
MANVWIEALITFIKVFFTLVFLLLFLYTIGYLVIMFFPPQRRWWIWYTLFRKPYKEEDVEWCMNARERGMKPKDIRSFLLRSSTPVHRVEEILFINSQLQLMEGGEKYGRLESVNAKAQLPKI